MSSITISLLIWKNNFFIHIILSINYNNDSMVIIFILPFHSSPINGQKLTGIKRLAIILLSND